MVNIETHIQLDSGFLLQVQIQLPKRKGRV